jgi:hypothetical protein
MTNRYRRWSILLLGSHGQIIQLYRFKALFWVLFIIFLAALGTAAFYHYRHQEQARTIRDITLQVERLEKKLAEFTRERVTPGGFSAEASLGEDTKFDGAGENLSQSTESDQWEASDEDPVLEPPPAELPPEPIDVASSPGNEDPVHENATADSSGEGSARTTDGEDPATASGGKLEESSGSAETPSTIPSLDPHQTIKRASISHFRSTPLADVHQLKLSYRIKNELRSEGKLKGYTYVLLEGERDGVAHYVVVPDGLTTSERPPLQSQGYDFAANNYLTIRLTAESIQDTDWIRQATIYVCSSESALLHSEQVPLTIP